MKVTKLFSVGCFFTFCLKVMANDYHPNNNYYLNNNNFNSIYDDRFGHYHLQEDINLQGQSLPPLGTEIEPFAGNVYGHGFAIKNFTIGSPDNPSTQQGFFTHLGNGVEIKELSLENARIYSQLASVLAGSIGDNCKIFIDHLSNIAVSSFLNVSGLLLGSTGDYNEVTLGYSDFSGHSGLHGAQASSGLIGRLGNHNIVSIGLGRAQIISGSGSATGVVARAGINNTITDSIVFSLLYPQSSDRRAMVLDGEGVACENSFWSSSATEATQSGCDVIGYTDHELRQLTRDSPGLTTEANAFRFGDQNHLPMALKFGQRFSELNDPICSLVVCQPDLCDSGQGASFIQIYAGGSKYYAISIDLTAENTNLSFRVARIDGDTLDRSFGDDGMIRYFSLEPGVLTDFTPSDAGTIYNGQLLVVGSSGSSSGNSIKILSFPLNNSEQKEASYRVNTPNLRGIADLQNPVPVWLGLTPFVTGYLFLIFSINRTNRIELLYFLLGDVPRDPTNLNRSFRASPIRFDGSTDGKISIASSHSHPGGRALFVSFYSKEKITTIARLELTNFNLSNLSTLNIKQLINDPARSDIYIRDRGLWLVQSNNAGNYSAELFGYHQFSENNSTAVYTLTGTDANGNERLIPNNNPRAELYFTAFNGNCLNLNILGIDKENDTRADTGADTDINVPIEPITNKKTDQTLAFETSFDGVLFQLQFLPLIGGAIMSLFDKIGDRFNVEDLAIQGNFEFDIYLGSGVNEDSDSIVARPYMALINLLNALTEYLKAASEERN